MRVPALFLLASVVVVSAPAQRDTSSGPALPIPGEIDVMMRATWPDSGILANWRVQVGIQTLEEFPPQVACFDWDSLGTRPDTLVLRIRGRTRCNWPEPILMEHGVAALTVELQASRSMVIYLPTDTAVLRIDHFPGPVPGIEMRPVTKSPRFHVPRMVVGPHEWGMASVRCNPHGTSDHLCLGFIETVQSEGTYESVVPTWYWQQGVLPPMRFWGHTVGPTSEDKDYVSHLLRRELIVFNGDTANIARLLDFSRRFTALFRTHTIEVTTTWRTRYHCREGACEGVGLEWSI